MKSECSVPKLLTVGEIASRHEVSVHRVVYVLRSRSEIRPAAVAGRIRLFDRAAESQILEALDETDEARTGERVGA